MVPSETLVRDRNTQQGKKVVWKAHTSRLPSAPPSHLAGWVNVRRGALASLEKGLPHLAVTGAGVQITSLADKCPSLGLPLAGSSPS